MRVTKITDKGGRSVNEDFIGEIKKNNILCVVVCDGLGGHNSGETASRTAVTAILREFERKPSFSAEALESYIKRANFEVIQRSLSNPAYFGMASTAAVLLVRGNRAVWANVGDTRVYRLDGTKIAEVTEDHSIAFDSFKRGFIEYDDIRSSEDQNKLTNALGTEEMRIDISEERFTDKNTAFILCTDGWWEYVTEKDIEEAAEKYTDTRVRLEYLLELREKKAPVNSDNYTAAIVSK